MLCWLCQQVIAYLHIQQTQSTIIINLETCYCPHAEEVPFSLTFWLFLSSLRWPYASLTTKCSTCPAATSCVINSLYHHPTEQRFFFVFFSETAAYIWKQHWWTKNSKAAGRKSHQWAERKKKWYWLERLFSQCDCGSNCRKGTLLAVFIKKKKKTFGMMDFGLLHHLQHRGPLLDGVKPQVSILLRPI